MVAGRKRAKFTALVIITLLVIALIINVAYSQKEDKKSDELATYKIGPVVSLSQCGACHEDIDSYSRPNLKFNHWVHFKQGTSCTSCHLGPAHQDGKTSIPQMELCFSCHKLLHSNQGVAASGDCNTCHSPDFNRVPSDHTANFKASGHKNISDLQINHCMLCHTKNNCKSCHDREKVKSDYSKYEYKAKYQPETRPELQLLTFDKVASLSQCNTCHTDLDANKAPGLIFNHWIHFDNGVQCSTCHQGLVHKTGETKRPTMDFCYSCHGTVHSKQGLVATEACGKCHTAGFNLVPSSHGAGWGTNHKKYVKEEMFSCMICHQKSFCQNCHTANNVKPSQITPIWKQKNRHDQAHAQKGKDCTICHNDDFCKKCHKTPVPHNYTFLGDHQVILKSDKSVRDDCYICHQEKTFCNKCHHAAKAATLYAEHFRSNELTLQNCVQCHKDLKASKDTLVKRGERAFVYHKVHFKKKYSCNECHLAGLRGLKNDTFELCKIEGCHPEGQKKPISGQKLCKSCHFKPHER